ncbi:SusD/RagB family nutrient-binding outer membrane lipoprotein [Niabella drilacis]|uniref:Starch-binding associating with outer membrane n=1 Tax=Niabella drilacis (strain DSM 25811 / CCM 8410 / CCUG 62505 / LMG 26954 / E90) TaxID=1285928 RepID=A0A1G7BPE6_NIADE|nr:SusD/RagB family nutrient-binding outer membrane lipoprotein [Niabella drilacis]SDE28929.1 Starch-binding associating with outer membrane [Niabella drilacis]
MKQIMKKTGLLCLSGVLLLSSCSKFGEINTNPDATEKVNASLLATNIILQNLKFQGRDAKACLSDNGLAKYIAYGNETILSSQYNYLGATDFGPMLLATNAASMVNYATGSVMEDSYKGLAKFSRAYMFYNLTMQVGDIPYSAAGQGGSGNIRAAYDTQEEVLRGILDELKEADQYFARGVRFDGDPSPYAGDPDKWRRAVNAFSLKVLLSLSPKAGTASLDIKNRFAAIANSGALLQNNTGFLGLNYSTTNVHPLSGTNDLFTSRTIISALVIDQLKQLNDRRLYYFADPAKAQITNGVPESDPAAYVGADVSADYNDITANLIANKYALINSRYLKEAVGDPRILISYAEQQLVLAEARILGWITTGSAKAYYESGVKAALATLLNAKASYAHGMPLTQAYIDGYFTGEAAFKSSPDDQLKQIWLQRYLLNFMQDPQTAFFEYRRTKFPAFPVNPATSLNENNKNAIPVRWLYPSSEVNYNKANLIEALNRQYGGVDEINKVMWLLK